MRVQIHRIFNSVAMFHEVTAFKFCDTAKLCISATHPGMVRGVVILNASCIAQGKQHAGIYE